ncbi:MAG TPA: tRNA (N6-threonylcarbamoyladenosine(37)-N6)-methyltransferase TrmO [Candidatus Rifleibacterium sp.]|nr:tRNA (N6-threonylcarbamoyladenosine(37)-N6)-methyltransferase TrmO [Candidatus Rifleibacterium sp.]HPT45784.1 tRNA (N6-threonylcarbamoyladenosine(37)-N6)-methyltransferase TrmO [Candidatus Rifleibacterium sp.]
MFTFTPIGYLRCSRAYHQEQPMQGVLSESGGYVELLKGCNYEQGLKDLAGFDHVWLLYVFHHNSTWKPLANPPYSDGKGRKGVFATRSPYRPNPIGLSCVRLQSITGNRVYVAGSDLLDNTPILDIKPYIPEYDSFPEARRGWLAEVDKTEYHICCSPQAEAQLGFLDRHGVDLRGVIATQLGHNPFDATRNKFISNENGFLLRFRSWRVEFAIAEQQIMIAEIISGYQNFLAPLGNDSPDDMAVHQAFCGAFPAVVRQQA